MNNKKTCLAAAIFWLAMSLCRAIQGNGIWTAANLVIANVFLAAYTIISEFKENEIKKQQ